jgi:hypothetical protein
LLKKSGIENDITWYLLVFGYKIFDKSYYDFNYFLKIIGFLFFKYFEYNIFFLNDNTILFKRLLQPAS